MKQVGSNGGNYPNQKWEGTKQVGSQFSNNPIENGKLFASCKFAWTNYTFLNDGFSMRVKLF